VSASLVQSLHTYPIKSTAGIELLTTWVDELGISFDRRFVLTALNGQFITARIQPKLCLIQSHLITNGLMLTAPNMPSLKIEFSRFSEQYHSVTVWKDQINSLYCHQHYDKWFSEYLAMPCQLHYFSEKSSRKVKNKQNPVSFADGYPLLLISQASLDDLNHRITGNEIEQPQIVMSQFRPNIVATNTTAFEEDSWRRIRIGEVEFEVAKPCSRCIFTTINPETAEKHSLQEPLATLKHYRQVEGGDVMFGQNLIPLNNGQIKQGDQIQVLETQSPIVFSQASSIKNVTESEIEEALKPIEKNVNTVPKKVNIVFDSWNTTHKGNTTETILEQGESAGLILPYSCRGGMCGRCKIKLDKGEVEQLADDGLTDDEKAQGYVLACSAIPQSDLTLSAD